jgi:hypothetical protein
MGLTRDQCLVEIYNIDSRTQALLEFDFLNQVMCDRATSTDDVETMFGQIVLSVRYKPRWVRIQDNSSNHNKDAMLITCFGTNNRCQLENPGKPPCLLLALTHMSHHRWIIAVKCLQYMAMLASIKRDPESKIHFETSKAKKYSHNKASSLNNAKWHKPTHEDAQGPLFLAYLKAVAKASIRATRNRTMVRDYHNKNTATWGR